MKIGIYGCSYAADLYNQASYTDYNTIGKPWSVILKEKKYNITNFAQSGSSVYYSYKKYKEHNTKFDKNIIVVTFPDRITITVPGYKTPLFVTFWNTINNHMRDYYKKIGLYDAIRLYYEHIHNMEEFDDYRELIINYLNQQKNTLVIDVKILHKISVNDNAFFTDLYKSDIADPTIYRDCRFNHLNNYNNIVLASIIEKWIETGEFIVNTDDFKVASADEFNMYYVKHEI